MELEDLLAGERDELDEHPTPVLYVAHPAHEPGELEAIEKEGHRAGAETRQIGEGACGKGAMLIEQVARTGRRWD